MKPDELMATAHEEKVRVAAPSGPAAQKPPHVRAPVFAIVALVLCAGASALRDWPVAAVAGLSCLGFLTGWVYGTFSDFRNSGKQVPLWLAFLERLREYLASEPPPVAR